MHRVFRQWPTCRLPNALPCRGIDRVRQFPMWLATLRVVGRTRGSILLQLAKQKLSISGEFLLLTCGQLLHHAHMDVIRHYQRAA